MEPANLENLEAWFEKLKEKLNPSRFPDMKPSFTILVRAILEPRRDLYIDADGFIFDEERGFLGTRQWLTKSWEDFFISPKAGLTAEEYQEAQGFFRCCLNFWRCEAPDKKPYMDRFAKAISIAYKVTDNPEEIAALVVEIVSPKDRKAQKN